MSKLIWVFLISAVPLIEQRGAIPVGILVNHYNPALVFLVSFLGSMLPVPFVLLLFNRIFEWMKKIKFFNKFSAYVEKKINKNTDKMEKYKEIGLIIFIGIPLPTTGLWTGSAIAAFLKLDFKKSVICAALGGLISAFIITVLCVAIPSMFSV